MSDQQMAGLGTGEAAHDARAAASGQRLYLRSNNDLREPAGKVQAIGSDARLPMLAGRDVVFRVLAAGGAAAISPADHADPVVKPSAQTQ